MIGILTFINFVAITGCFVIYENHITTFTTTIQNVTMVYATSLSKQVACLKVPSFMLAPELVESSCTDMYLEVIISYNHSYRVHDDIKIEVIKQRGFIQKTGGMLLFQQLKGKHCSKIKR